MFYSDKNAKYSKCTWMVSLWKIVGILCPNNSNEHNISPSHRTLTSIYELANNLEYDLRQNSKHLAFSSAKDVELMNWT
jgi:hypothetical protein